MCSIRWTFHSMHLTLNRSSENYCANCKEWKRHSKQQHTREWEIKGTKKIIENTNANEIQIEICSTTTTTTAIKHRTGVVESESGIILCVWQNIYRKYVQRNRKGNLKERKTVNLFHVQCLVFVTIYCKKVSVAIDKKMPPITTCVSNSGQQQKLTRKTKKKKNC